MGYGNGNGNGITQLIAIFLAILAAIWEVIASLLSPIKA